MIEIDPKEYLAVQDISGDNNDSEDEEREQTVEEMVTLRNRLVARRCQIERMPFQCPEFERTKANLTYEIWILSGVIDHGYSRDILEHIAAMHKA